MGKSLKKNESRILKSFMDIAVLSILRRNEDLSGHGISKYIHKKLGILPSPGSVYSTLYALEREQLVKGVSHSRSRTYRPTSKGLAKLREVDEMQKVFDLFITKLCGNKVKQSAPIEQ